MGIKVCRMAPQLNHLLFANDSPVFCKANKESSQTLLEVLSKYARASGQCINTSNTTIAFSGNVRGNVRGDIMTLWGATESH